MQNAFVHPNIPVLETPRLIMRGHRREDFEAMVALYHDPAVTQHFHGQDQSREELWARFLRAHGCWAFCGYGVWAVIEKSTGSYAGVVGCFETKRGLHPSLEEVPEAGWTLGAAFQGKGYASEAALAALSWFDTVKGIQPMFCIVSTANAASLRVAEKCGFKPAFAVEYKGDPTRVFKRNWV